MKEGEPAFLVELEIFGGLAEQLYVKFGGPVMKTTFKKAHAQVYMIPNTIKY